MAFVAGWMGLILEEVDGIRYACFEVAPDPTITQIVTGWHGIACDQTGGVKYPLIEIVE